MKRFIAFVVAFGVLGVCVQQAQAADGHVAWSDLAWRMVNFVCFIGILWWAFGKKIAAALRGRRESISDDLEHLETARAEAQKQLKDLTARIANVEVEASAIVEESRVQALAAKERIIADARRQAEEILAQARLSAENEARHMVRDVRAALADDVVDAVKVSLGERLDPAEHERLISNALKKVVIQ